MHRMMINWSWKVQVLWIKFLKWLGFYPRTVFYIGGSEALPPPLTSEEETVYCPGCNRVTGGKVFADRA